MYKCEVCDKDIKKENVLVYPFNIICRDCYNICDLCMVCGAFKKKIHTKIIDGVYMCDYCFSTRFVCKNCGKMDLKTYISRDDLMDTLKVCKRCFNLYYRNCDICKEYFNRERASFYKYNSIVFCNNCEQKFLDSLCTFCNKTSYRMRDTKMYKFKRKKLCYFCYNNRVVIFGPSVYKRDIDYVKKLINESI